MLYVDYEANTVDEAVVKAVEKLGVNKADITTEVLREAKRGIFGIGQKALAKVRIYYKEKNDIDAVLANVKGLVMHLDEEAKINFRKLSETRYDVVINSQNISHMIGKKGKTLKAMQTLVNSFLQKYNNPCSIIVDIDHYNMKREEQFSRWAEGQAREVLKTKRSIVLKSLNSYERRIIHLEITKFKDIVSESKGKGRIKNIKIKYVGS